MCVCVCACALSGEQKPCKVGSFSRYVTLLSGHITALASDVFLLHSGNEHKSETRVTAGVLKPPFHSGSSLECHGNLWDKYFYRVHLTRLYYIQILFCWVKKLFTHSLHSVCESLQCETAPLCNITCLWPFCSILEIWDLQIFPQFISQQPMFWFSGFSQQMQRLSSIFTQSPELFRNLRSISSSKWTGYRGTEVYFFALILQHFRNCNFW